VINIDNHLCERPPLFWRARQQKSLGVACMPHFGIIVVLAHHDAVKVLCP
jgi:hypothetical protein